MLYGCNVNAVYTTEASPRPLDEEPEEELTLEQVKEKAEAGDARAQTRVSQHTCTVGLLALLSVLQFDSVWLHLCLFLALRKMIPGF